MDFLHDSKGTTRLINRIFHLISLNLIWLVCCIPIVTIGAATTAMYDVLLRLCFYEEISVVHTFFKKFLFHLKKATVLFLLVVVGTAFFAFDFWCSFFLSSAVRLVFQVFILCIGYFWAAFVCFLFPTLAYFNFNIKRTLKYAFAFAMKNGVYTLFIMLISFLPFLLFLLVPGFYFNTSLLWITIGFAVLAQVNAMYFARIFDENRLNQLQNQSNQENSQR